MNQENFHRCWRREYRQLLKRQDSLLSKSHDEGLPEQIHELRVTLRRLRLMVRVSAPLLEFKSAQRYRRWSRQVSDATSRIRDFDVTMEWLATQTAGADLSEDLRSGRRRLWKAGRRYLVRAPSSVRKSIKEFEFSKRGAQSLNRRYPSRFARLHARVVANIPRFFEMDEAGRHAFRRTTRLLRYLRELGLTGRQRRTDHLLAALARPQSAMGEYQNLALAGQILRSLESPALPATILRALVRDQAHWQRQIKASLRDLARIYRAEVQAGHLHA